MDHLKEISWEGSFSKIIRILNTSFISSAIAEVQWKVYSAEYWKLN